MQFLVIGHDGTDEKALERRMAAREAHIAYCDRLHAAGTMLYGVALLNDEQKMVGSVIVCDFPSRKELDAYLKEEPYVKGDVWKKIEVHNCKVGPTFAKLTAASQS